jgi:hypothetical protein
MVRTAWMGVCLAGMVLLASCAGSSQMLSRTTANMAGALKSFCEQHNIRTVETRTADSLYVQATVKLQKGMKVDGYATMDLAVIYYRLALSKQELAMAEKRLDEAREQISEQEQHLHDYNEVLAELKGGAR